MTPPVHESDLPLPEFGDVAPDGTDHPVLSAILAGLRDRTDDAATVVAYYEDAP